MSNLGDLLQTLRQNKSFSLREAADKTGLSHTYISDIEKGMRRGTRTPLHPSPDTLKRLADAYDYPYHKLLEAAGYLDENYEPIGDEFDKPLTRDKLARMINSYTKEERERAARILEAVFPNKEDTD